MRFSRLFLLISLCQTSLITSLYGQNISYHKALITKLFTTDGYDKRIRPVQNMMDTTNVTLTVFLSSIIELDEVEEKLVTTASLHLTWNDTNLMWNTTDYDNTLIMFLPQDDVWKPDVILLNSVKDYKELGSTNLQVVVHFDGSVNWYPIQKFESECAINIRYFPFDLQKCRLKFGAWSYTNLEIILSSGSEGISLDFFSENSVWKVESSNWYAVFESGEPAISFNINLRRKPLFVILTTVVPIAMLSFLNTLVFVLPNESGEKSGYAVTVFLALAVFLTIISSTLPANSDSISIFSIYITAQTVQSTVITTITLIMIRLSGLEDPNLIPRCLVKFTLFLQRIRSRKNRVHDSQEELVSDDKDVIEVEDVTESTPEKSNRLDSLKNVHVSWSTAMDSLDVVAYIFFTLTSFLITIVCLLSAKYGS